MSASSSESQMKIYVRNNDVNKALRVLKKKMLNEGIMKEVRENQYFRSKGEQKRLDAKAGRKRWEKKLIQLEQKFIREERNQIRNNRKRKNVQRPNQNSNQQRGQRNSGNQNSRKPRT